MPKLVDHDVRRGQITDAARRVISSNGLTSATFQAVAKEAEVSVRLVQYYFGDKATLLSATHRAVIESSAARFTADADGSDSPSTVLRGIVAALLPLDDDRRADALVLNAFQSAALFSQEQPQATGQGDPATRLLTEVIAAQLGGADEDRDSRANADLVIATTLGLTQSILAGHHSPEDAMDIVDRLLGLVAPEA